MDRTCALYTYLAKASDRAFEPGQFDCALFAAGWIDEVQGSNLVGTFQGQYETIEEGVKRLRQMTGRTIRDIARAWATPVGGWAFAEPGDIVLVKEGALCFGIVGAGGHIHVLRDGGGLDVIPLDRAWEVFRP